MKAYSINNTLFLILFLIFNTEISFAFVPKHHFKHYTINNGLSQNTVYSIFQDKQGFMWFGTKDGLNRFDGENFKIFRFSPNQKLRDNVFRRILQTEDENIWVATDQGVYIYNPRNESFDRFEQKTLKNESISGKVSDMILDNDGDVWISVEEKGVFNYQITSKELFFYPISQSSKGINLLTLCLGKNGNIWVFPYLKSFLQINKTTKQISEFELESSNSLMFEVGELSSVISNEFNELILATSQKGVISINLVSKTHKILLDKDTNNKPIFARSILQVSDNDLWIGTESGIYVYDIKQNKYSINLKHLNSVEYSLSDNAIYSLYKDKHQGIWVGTYFGGVNYYPNHNSGFESFYKLIESNSISGNRVREFCKAPNSKLYI